MEPLEKGHGGGDGERAVVDYYCKFIVHTEKEGVIEEGTWLGPPVLFWRQ